MSRLTRDGTAGPVSRDQILRHARGQENIHFPCSADHEQDWQPYPVDPYSVSYPRVLLKLCGGAFRALGSLRDCGPACLHGKMWLLSVMIQAC